MDLPANSNAESHFNIHWDDFNRVVVDSLWNLFAEESLTDCTLVVSPQEQVQVHRVVLSANSPYFRSLLHAHSHHPNPIIILHDVSYTTLKMLVTFMYRGQVSVTSEEMTTLLKAAEHLQILGLSQTRKSPVSFAPTTVISSTGEPQQSTSSSVLSSTIGFGTTSSATATTGITATTSEPQQVYSKKSRILDQNKSISASSSLSSSVSRSGTPSSFREREYETATIDKMEQRSPLPLSLKKEDEAETHVWKEGLEERMEHQEESTLCLRYCCPYCSTNFPSQSSLSRHIMVVHPTVYSALYEPTPSTSSQCTATESLPQPPPTSSAVTSPIDHNHLESRVRSEEMEETSDGSSGIACKFCGKPFSEVSQLIQHLPIHTGERPFKCPFCDKAFKLRHHMKDHARVHTGERPFRCQLCNKTFSRSTILKAHEKTHFPKGSGP